ncbi:MAG: phosphomethylpyrimidine synthase ThiC [Candidatus Omnitrophica bacterium]|nr:phosphomethylpyrimidine synthase ThiC [Candidatus Omnitrophota bacterium]
MQSQIIKKIAEDENISPKVLKIKIDRGKAVLVKNKKRKIKPLTIGEGLRVKVNANIGASTKNPEIKDELKKLKVAQEAGADSIMDLSVGGDLKNIRKQILAASKLIVGTVPIYEAAVKSEKKYGSFERMTNQDILDVIEAQAKEGVDFFTIHSGITKKIANNRKITKRKGGIVSRGGAIISRWIMANQKENPLYEYFDDILDIAKKYDIVLSLGDGLRPGAISDSMDFFQVSELLNLGILTEKARKKNVGIIIEGPGHVPIDQIEANIRMEKEICKNAPFYVLGPLVTDTALGFDHISSAIGGALASLYGADFLCVVTPKEHLGHPNQEDIKLGVIAARIAAHSVNLTRNKRLRKIDEDISTSRKKRDWKKHISLGIYPKAVEGITEKLKFSDACSMCGKYCSLKIMEDCPLV